MANPTASETVFEENERCRIVAFPAASEENLD